MTSMPCPSCRAPIAIRSPEEVVRYLEGKGWHDEGICGTWHLFSLDALGETQVQVPTSATFRDYPRRFWELLDDLARIEGRGIQEIVAEMWT